MARKTSTLEQNIAWNSIGSLFYLGCNWLLTILVVRLNSSYFEAGILSLGMSISTALWGLMSLNLRTFQISDLNGVYTDGDFIINRIATCVVSLLFCSIIVIYNNYDPYTVKCIFAYMTVKISEAIVDVFHGIDQKAWRLDIAGKSSILRGISVLLGFLAGELLFHDLLAAIVLMSVSLYAVIIFYDCSVCKKEVGINFTARKKNFSSLMYVGIPLGLYMSILNLIGVVPRLHIEKILGAEKLGIFASISTITVLIPQFCSLIFNPLMGIFAQHWEKQNKKSFLRMFWGCFAGILCLGIVVIIFCFWIGEPLLVLIFGESIRIESTLLVPIVGTAILTTMIWFLGGIFTVLRDSKFLFGGTLVSFVACFVTSELLIHQNGLIGAVQSTAIGLGLDILLLMIRFGYFVRVAPTTKLK